MFVDKLNHLTALPDFRDKTTVLQPGESVTLYGGITFVNNSTETVAIEVVDHLLAKDGLCGLYYRINGGELIPVKLNSTVPLDKSISLISVLENMF